MYFATEEDNYFKAARDSVDLFVLIHSFISGQIIMVENGAAIEIKNYDSLGKQRITFGDFEKINVHGNSNNLLWPIFETKKRFLELIPDRQKIMGGHLGIALSYYYYAIRASRRRLDEVIIDLMIAAEALLVTKSVNIRGALSKRLSTMNASNQNERTTIARRICDLYDLRSAIVHGSGKKPMLNEGRELFEYVRKALDEALSLRALSKHTLIEKLDKDWG